MKTPRWARTLVRWLAPGDQVDNVLGDLEERRLTTIETLDLAAALVRARVAVFRMTKGSGTVQDYKLGVRMLLKYPGLTIAGGLALAIAIGVGAGYYDFMGDFFRPRLPLPGGDRIVEVEMRNANGGGDERRIAHDLAGWQRDARSLQDLGAFRTSQRNLLVTGVAPEGVTVAETTANMFRVAGVPTALGRHLFDTDEHPGATPVAVIGHDIWQRVFGGRSDVLGQLVQVGDAKVTIVGVMPERFAFPVNHRMWMPLSLETGGYAPLEGPGIRVFGRVAPGSTQAQANAEIATLAAAVKAASPKTHQHLTPRVLAWGGESPGDKSILELVITYLPIFLVLTIACVNVGTLIYARTATREAEIAMRYALGASRGRIITQLFVEALVLASLAAVVGLTAAHFALKWALTAFFAAQGGLPFWLDPGLNPTTILFAAPLTILGAAMLGVLPGLKATGKNAQSQLRNLGSGGSTLRFGAVWTGAMIAQVALTVIVIPPALGASEESWTDQKIRGRFPTEQYLAVRFEVDRDSAAQVARFPQLYNEIERRVAQQPGVVATTFGDRLPGMDPDVKSAEIELPSAEAPKLVETVWLADVGPNYFQTFGVPLVAGRDFHDGDRTGATRTILVNENFARVHLGGANPIGRRVRFASPNAESPEPWLEIVGMVRDVGMQPTGLGEAPHIYGPASITRTAPLVMGIHTSGDPVTLSQRVREIAAEVDPGFRLGFVRSLEDLAWEQDFPNMIVAGAIVTVVTLGLFMSAAGIFSLMSVNVARRTKEIGLRAALGATQMRLLGGIFKRALILIGSGVAAGNAVLLLFVALSDEVDIFFVADALMGTSAIMLTVGLLACIEPARRALRIAPTDALKEA